jgi:hypothetical protein
MMRPIIAANREQQTKERHVRFWICAITWENKINKCVSWRKTNNKVLQYVIRYVDYLNNPYLLTNHEINYTNTHFVGMYNADIIV